MNNMSIGRRLSVSVGAGLAIVAVVIVIGLVSMKTMSERTNRIVNVNQTKMDNVQIMSGAVKAVERSTLIVLVTKTQADIGKQSLAKSRAAYAQALENLEKIEDTPKGKELIQQIKDCESKVRGSTEQSIAMTLGGKEKDALDNYLGQAYKFSNNLYALCNQMVQYQREQSGLGYAQAMSAYNTAWRLFLRDRHPLDRRGRVFRLRPEAEYYHAHCRRGVGSPKTGGG